MHHLLFPEHGLRIALAALVSLAIAPAAAADDGLPVLADPTELAEVLVEPANTDPVALDPAALVATVTEALPDELPTLPAAEAVPAAAAKPMPALEPQPKPLGTPPPPPQPAVGPKVVDVGPDPDASAPQGPVPASKPQSAAVEEPQYQPAPPQYQSFEPVDLPEEPATSPAEQEWSWSANSSCGNEASPGALLDDIVSWNGYGSCADPLFYSVNNVPQNPMQYHVDTLRYHPLNVSVSIRMGETAGESRVLQANVVVAVEGQPVIASAHGPPPAPAEPVASQSAPAPDPSGDPANARPDDARAAAPSPSSAPNATLSSPWTPRPAMPREIRHRPDGHRSRSPLRQPTRRPLPPLRGPVIPVGSAGAAPLGGADGGGFHPALLLAPFALAPVDGARRVVRDAAPPVVRERDKRRKRPG